MDTPPHRFYVNKNNISKISWKYMDDSYFPAACAKGGIVQNEAYSGSVRRMNIALLSLSLIVVVSGGLVDDKARRTLYKMMEALKSTPKKLPKVKLGHVDVKNYSIPEVYGKSGVNRTLFLQGDILLTKSQTDGINKKINKKIGGTRGKKRQAVTNTYYLWPGGNVYYRFDAYLDGKAKRLFLRGAARWQKDSCVNFIYDPNLKAADRIIVKGGQGCSSALGGNGGEQKLFLGKDCDLVRSAAHEIGHALGLYHTIKRNDRDNFVKVNMANVEPDWRVELSKNTGETFHLPYDYGSIMHYSGSRFP
ncbi:astacin [Teladorsagia circumcincta]|uniref:Metalloendopeptidase n=1 Tax=Teladorsagia circumcincta TaxID=45464 RepID=A0A2G9UM24_TELCI|nr:astacin [Teladorsagia circumcincta]